MRDFHYLVVILVSIGVASCSHRARVAAPGERPPSHSDLRIGTIENGRTMVRVVEVEDYVRGTVLAEFTPGPGDPLLVRRMLEVQAITARSFAVAHRNRHAREGFDLCTTTHCQIYEPDRILTSRWRQPAVDAIDRTRGIVLWYDARPAEVVFHADCGGHTAAAADVWGGAGRRYLVAQSDEPSPHQTWEFSATVAETRDALNSDERTRVGSHLEGIRVLERDGSGRARRIQLLGAQDLVVSGEEVRRALSRVFGARSLRSTLFDVRRTGESITFSGRGFGHGVGLCQAGALARLRRGSSPEAVLEHYFPGTRLRKEE